LEILLHEEQGTTNKNPRTSRSETFSPEKMEQYATLNLKPNITE
jgi:hypothetical protein